MSSLFESCLDRVILSATNDVRRLSIAPSSASTNAASMMINRDTVVICGRWICGNPLGIFPRMGIAPAPMNKLNVVPIINAANGPGRYLPNFAGHFNAISNVRAPRKSVMILISLAAVGAWSSASTVPAGVSCPSKGLICRIIMIPPMPLIKPLITG